MSPPNTSNDSLDDGACEPLARYLSYQMKREVDHADFSSISKTSHTRISKLEILDPRESVELVFGEYIRQELPSPLFWGSKIAGSWFYAEGELSDRELKCTVQETAQYSLHVVGLVFDKQRSRILIADPNGALIPGSNMEFLSITGKY